MTSGHAYHVFFRNRQHPEVFRMLVCDVDQWVAVELVATLRLQLSLSANFSWAEGALQDGHFGVMRFVGKTPIIMLLNLSEEEADAEEFEQNNVRAFNAAPMFKSPAAALEWIKSQSRLSKRREGN